MMQEKNDFMVHAISVLRDNVIWVWVAGNRAVVVDPAISKPVHEFLESENLILSSILQTHHHEDHIGGTEDLLQLWPSASVIASKEDITRIPFQTDSVSNGDTLNLMGCQAKVISVPGHTKTHLAFYISNIDQDNCPTLFCGDTLFGAGCGRLFEGTSTEMFNSLQQIKSLPLNTKIYCAHEYTESNLRWANSLYPEDLLIKARMESVIETRKTGQSSLPSLLSEEIKTNLFLRASSIQEFSKLRRHKDHWQEK